MTVLDLPVVGCTEYNFPHLMQIFVSYIFVYNTNNYFIIALSLLPTTMKFRKIVETSVYSSDLEKMKEFYVDKLGLEFVSEQRDRHVFLKTGKNMFLIFNPEVTAVEKETIHGAPTPPSMIHSLSKSKRFSMS